MPKRNFSIQLKKLRMKSSTLAAYALVEVALLAAATTLELHDHSATFLWAGATVLFLSILGSVGEDRDDDVVLSAEVITEPKCACKDALGRTSWKKAEERDCANCERHAQQ